MYTPSSSSKLTLSWSPRAGPYPVSICVLQMMTRWGLAVGPLVRSVFSLVRFQIYTCTMWYHYIYNLQFLLWPSVFVCYYWLFFLICYLYVAWDLLHNKVLFCSVLYSQCQSTISTYLVPWPGLHIYSLSITGWDYYIYPKYSYTQLFTILVLEFKQVHLTTSWSVKTCWVANSADPAQLPCSVAYILIYTVCLYLSVHILE